MSVIIRRAIVEDANVIAPLFNAYRMFYRQHSNIGAALDFITKRLAQNQSAIFIADDGGKAVGFTQLYPIFSSVGLTNAWLLNDLYVTEGNRGKGVATALLEAAKQLGRKTGSGWLMLQTAVNNHIAQKVYGQNGWIKEKDYEVYTFTL